MKYLSRHAIRFLVSFDVCVVRILYEYLDDCNVVRCVLVYQGIQGSTYFKSWALICIGDIAQRLVDQHCDVVAQVGICRVSFFEARLLVWVLTAPGT
jgi:hypothetical protein